MNLDKYERIIRQLEDMRDRNEQAPDDPQNVLSDADGWDQYGKFHGVYQAIGDIVHHIDSYQRRNKYLSERVQELEDEHYKDHQLADMRAYVERVEADMERGFDISADEEAAIASWEMQHRTQKHPSTIDKPWADGAIGGRFTYHFTPTNVGIVGEVECECGEKFCFRELK